MKVIYTDLILNVCTMSCTHRKKSSTKNNLALSANVSYEEVKIKPIKEKASGYENVEVILQSSGQGREGDKIRNRSVKHCTSKSTTGSEYIDRDDAIHVFSQQQQL